jgi:hypothetical protein
MSLFGETIGRLCFRRTGRVGIRYGLPSSIEARRCPGNRLGARGYISAVFIRLGDAALTPPAALSA